MRSTLECGEQGAAGRLAHVGASVQLVTIADDVVQVVQVMDGLNHVRFANDSAVFATWERDPRPPPSV